MIYKYLDLYIYIYIYLFIYLSMNLFHAGIVKTSQKCDEAKVEQWIKKILKDAPEQEKSSRKKARSTLLLRQCRRVLTVDFYWKFSKNFCPEQWLENFFCAYIWFALFTFWKNILVHFVTAGGLTKLLMQTCSITKIKRCSFSNNEFHCLLGRLFSRFQENWRVKRQT